MFASIGELTSHVISIPTSSEEFLYNRDTNDYKQGVEEEKEEIDYETGKQLEASGLTKTYPINQRSCH